MCPQIEDFDPIELFGNYLKITGVAHLEPERYGERSLRGKRLGLLNGSSWITLWANYFGRRFLPGVHLINVGNEAVQINFMQAYREGRPVPPPANIEIFARYARDLVELAQVDAILITCSTMNRSYEVVREAVEEFHVPVVTIDTPMMEKAVEHGGKILVVSTHGPTIKNTQALLEETAARAGRKVSFEGAAVEEAWQKLAEGDVRGHNRVLSQTIRRYRDRKVDSVVLAQLSMSVLLLSYPDPVQEFGIPVFTSGQCGFEYLRSLLR